MSNDVQVYEGLASLDLSKKKKKWHDVEITVQKNSFVRIRNTDSDAPNIKFDSELNCSALESLLNSSENPFRIGNFIVELGCRKGFTPENTVPIPVVSSNPTSSVRKHFSSFKVPSQIRNSSIEGVYKSTNNALNKDSKGLDTTSKCITSKHLTSFKSPSVSHVSLEKEACTNDITRCDIMKNAALDMQPHTLTTTDRISYSKNEVDLYFSDYIRLTLDEIKSSLWSSLNEIEHICKKLQSNFESSTVCSKLVKRDKLAFAVEKKVIFGCSNCEISIRDDSIIAKKRRFEEIDASCADTPAEQRMFLKMFLGTKNNIGEASLSKGDIWIMWEDSADIFDVSDIFPRLPKSDNLASVRDDFIQMWGKGYPFPWYNSVIWKPIILARSMWYGISEQGCIQIDMLDQNSGRAFKFPKKLSAVRVKNDVHTLQALDLLRGGITNFASCPIFLNGVIASDGRIPSYGQPSNGVSISNVGNKSISPLLKNSSFSDGKLPLIDDSIVNEIVLQVKEDFKLNERQFQVLNGVGDWFRYSRSSLSDSIIRVHGIFGSGKSHLLASICIFLCSINSYIEGSTSSKPMKLVRTMISSNTNVAVDRVLLGVLNYWQERSFCESSAQSIARIGNPSKIDKDLRKFLVLIHESSVSAQKELLSILKQDNDSELRELLKLAQSKEYFRSQLQRVQHANIVGVTCASSSSSHLSGMHFPILIIDEATQITEPISLLPLASANPSHLIIVGDPKQLSPAVSSSSTKEITGNQGNIGLSLFHRLDKINRGYGVFLDTQYRCHPAIANLCSELFYDGKIKSGIQICDRRPLIDHLLPVVSVHCQGQLQKHDQSLTNREEAIAICNFLRYFRSRKLLGMSIGVISMYKSQAFLIRETLASDQFSGNLSDCDGAEFHLSNGDIKVSTVDAFQGQELDIVVISTCRGHSTCFLNNENRVNVALSRARHHVVIFGDFQMLSTDLLWSRIFHSSQQYKSVVEAINDNS